MIEASVFQGAPTTDALPPERLVILVPQHADPSVLAAMADRQAAAEAAPVLYLAVAPDPQQAEQELQRLGGLATESVPRVRREVRVLSGVSWPAAIDLVRRHGDLVVFPYPQGSSAPVPEGRIETWSQRAARSIVRLLLRLVDWGVPLGIVVGFFLLQTRIDRLEEAPGRILFVGLSVLIEIALLWRWEQWASRRLRS
jgi:hypothetical protein